MNKNFIFGLIALVLLIACGVVEVVVLKNNYKQMYHEVDKLLQLCNEHTLDKQTYQQFCDDWLDLREKSELFLPHIDVYEINLRIYETASYVEKQSYDTAHAHLSVVKQLLNYVPHLITQSFEHIF